jgi:integrase/recombinase XerD
MTDVSFADWLNNHDRRPATVRTYLRVVKNFVAWRMSDRQINDSSSVTVGRLDLADYRESLRQRGLKASSINLYLAALDTWLEWAIETNQRADNPAARLRRIKTTTSQRAPVALSRRDVSKLLDEAARTRHAARDGALVTLLVQTGLRVGEVCHLQWCDIDVGERAGHVMVRAGKGNKDRVVPLAVDTRKALWSYAQTLDPTLSVSSSDRSPRFDGLMATRFTTWMTERGTQPVFLSQKQRAIATQTVWELITTLAHRAGTKASPHTLRHTFGTELVRRGAALTVVANLLGHSSITTTQRYTQPSDADVAQAVDLLAWD